MELSVTSQRQYDMLQLHTTSPGSWAVCSVVLRQSMIYNIHDTDVYRHYRTKDVAFIIVQQVFEHVALDTFLWSIRSFQCFKACVFLHLLGLYEIFMFKIGFHSAQ